MIVDLPQPHADWNEGPFSSSRWFLACGLGGYNIVWVRTIGQAIQEGPPIMHMGRELHTYPSLRCYVYGRNVHSIDPVEGDWVRLGDLMGRFLFVGMNYPFFVDVPQSNGGSAAETVPVSKANCVFASHWRCIQYPLPGADWCRMPLTHDAAIGSSFFYPQLGWGQYYESPMWFLPTLQDK